MYENKVGFLDGALATVKKESDAGYNRADTKERTVNFKGWTCC